MAMGTRKQREKQAGLWIAQQELTAAPAHPFYHKRNELLEPERFDEFVGKGCVKFYAEKYGRPSLTQGIYFRALLIGYLEGIAAERGIARKMSSDIMPSMAKHIVHMSEAEAASNFAGVLARVRAGAEIVIEGHEPIVVRAEPVRGRLISDCIALAKAHEEETREVPVLDSDFAADMEEILKNRKAWNPPAWE
jgi:antitoxin (DNA-binding transcriptional repressor) of toxin-antitoxin stability system